MYANHIENRENLADYFVYLGFKKGAEIGVEQGVYTEVLCRTGMEIYAIDAWKSYSGYRDHVDQRKLDRFFEKTKEIVAPYNCHVVKAFSMDALKDFEDESLDFVYLDANHSFPYIAQDLWYWSKKVRNGGIVAGHDFKEFSGKYGLDGCHVKFVVEAWAKARNLEIFTTKERTPSWFYFK
jgi:hypothetical protein